MGPQPLSAGGQSDLSPSSVGVGWTDRYQEVSPGGLAIVAMRTVPPAVDSLLAIPVNSRRVRGGRCALGAYRPMRSTAGGTKPRRETHVASLYLQLPLNKTSKRVIRPRYQKTMDSTNCTNCMAELYIYPSTKSKVVPPNGHELHTIKTPKPQPQPEQVV